MVDQGHKKSGFVGQHGATNSITDRYFGYRRTLLNNGLPFSEDWVLVNNDLPTGLYRSNIALRRTCPPPSSVIATWPPTICWRR